MAELVVSDPGALALAMCALHGELERIDRLANRLRKDSELWLLCARAAQADGPVTVTPELLETVQVALDVAAATGGTVDPTVGQALCRIGYDRDFAAIAGGVEGQMPAPRPVPGWQTIEVDRQACTLRLPAGVQLDLGATAKALTADRTARRVHGQTGCGVLVSLGGDVAVAGAPGEGFSIGLADTCTQRETDQAIALSSGGLATSGTALRRWRLGDQLVHHILDPRTGLPAPAVWRTVTVCAASCVDANAASTAAVVMGRAAERWLAARRLPARLVGSDGAVVAVGGWPGEHDAATRPVADRPEAGAAGPGAR